MLKLFQFEGIFNIHRTKRNKIKGETNTEDTVVYVVRLHTEPYASLYQTMWIHWIPVSRKESRTRIWIHMLSILIYILYVVLNGINFLKSPLFQNKYMFIWILYNCMPEFMKNVRKLWKCIKNKETF